MGLQLESASQRSFEQQNPWRFRDVRLEHDNHVQLEAALFQASTIPKLNDRFRDLSKGNRADYHTHCLAPGVALSVVKPVKSAKPKSQQTGDLVSPPTTAATVGEIAPYVCIIPRHVDPALVFPKLVPSGKQVVSFPLQRLSTQERPCLKRRRPDTDVDGPNTASLSCKKRRLLRHLITSRLSQPFSLPATHILNREAVATGNNRFLKLAAILAARRFQSAGANSAQTGGPPHQPSPSTWLRRAAVLNSFRQRVCAEAAERGNPDMAALAARAAAFQHSPGTGVFVGGRYITDSTSRMSSPAVQWISLPTSVKPGAVPAAALLGAGVGVQAGSSRPGLQPAGQVSTRLVIPSPQLRPLRSPELRVTRPAVAVEDQGRLDDENGEEEEEEDDGVAFPTSEHESRYEDEPEDVYADFGVIFGGGEGDAPDEDGGGDHFEDYMDDLDGIPWNARC
ncbi:hypothetical protein N656DRAFT_792187 [Canariomyces notabilis]|uniref:Uncharacterized protein n=1 Tax=Canariomyces notabilis TaxID=2074819 RepID=A0AAN6QG20_9PEZI|nr:hypothetical protein N656DRAFT_792187 [Canariomyces arenarius]